MTAGEPLVSKRFPRSSTYHPEWVVGSASGGASVLWSRLIEHEVGVASRVVRIPKIDSDYFEE